MRVGRNPVAISVYKGVRQAAESLYSSMGKLSSGERIQRPGDAPADFGISEMLRFQIRNSAEAKRNIENVRNMLGSADTWMQTTNDILSRMSELSVSASDGSKSVQDRANLNEEFQQLKEEVGRIAREAKYNGVQVVGRDQLLSYDQDKKTFFFSQLDGGEKYTLPVKMMSGLQSKNSLDFYFDSSKAFTQSLDGRYIFYADSSNNVVKYDIEKGSLFRDTADTNTKAFDVDEAGRLWYSSETAPASGIYQLKQQDVTSWLQDTTLINTGDIADMASTEFRLHADRVYYFDTSGDIVSRNINNFNDVDIELASTDLTFTATAGQFSISNDGLYMADVPAAGVVRVTNMLTKSSQSFTVGAGITVSSLTFSGDNRELMYIDSAEDAIHRIKMAPGDAPNLVEDVKVHNPSGSAGFVGLNLDGGSHRANFRVHNGPDAIQESFLTTGDVRLVTLGITRVSVDTIENATIALAAVQKAIDKIAVQRAKLGAEASRIDHTYEALVRYEDNIAQADSMIRDVDIVKESSDMLAKQVQHEAAIAILAQANQAPQAVLRLLQR